MWRRWRRRWRGRGYHECPCRGRACPARSLTVEFPLTVCFVGRGLDPSATSRETAVNGISVEEGFIPPRPLVLPPPRRGRACPARSLAVAAPFIFRIVGSGLDRSAGRRRRRRQPRGRIGNPPLRPNKSRCPCAFHRQRLSIFQSSFQSRLIHTAGTSSSAPRPCWRPRPSCSQSQTRSLQCSRQSPSSRRDPCRGS